MIDTSGWKEFRIGDLFDVTSTKTTPLTVLEEEYGNGEKPYVTTQSVNNGVAGYYNIATEEGGVLTVDSAVAGQCFYQPIPFSASDHVEKLIPKFKINLEIGLFLQTIINQEQYKYSYGRKRSQKVLRDEIIKLPATSSGEPDWQYMEDFMGGLHCEPITTSVKSSHLPLETEKWGEFLLSDLFEIRMGNGFDKNKMTDDSPSVNFVSRVSYNNGVDCKVDTVEGTAPFPSGMITVALGGSYLGSSFVQNEPFYTGQNVAVMLPRCDIGLLEKIFICGLIRMESAYKYQAFGRELNSHIRKDFTIQLPVIDDGTPDWQWIENYMKSLPYSDRIA